MDATASAALIDRLVADRQTIAVAESCTGGLLGGHITHANGASRAFLGGVIAYTDAAKESLLGVDAAVLAQNGAVSAAVAEAMAHGARNRFGSTLALAVTGIAGPTGATKTKPVGTVWIAALGPGPLLSVHRLQAKGDRAAIRGEAVAAALRLLAKNLDEAEQEAIVG
jgi:PncC family amidohydrolase